MTALLIYPFLLLISLAGIFFLTRDYLREAKSLSREELMSRLSALRSVRSDIKERFFGPAIIMLRGIFLPAFWRTCEKAITRVRVLVSKLETRLKWLSDNIRGRHINLDVSKKSEYWQNLNGAKNGKNGTEEKPE